MSHSKTTKPDQDKTVLSILSQKALSRWDGEGGAGPDGPQKNDTELQVTSSDEHKSKNQKKSKLPTKKN
jgi:hypothetical protein